MISKTKAEKIIENMNSKPIIDVNVDVHIPRSANTFDAKKHKFKCSACGNGFTTQNGNFQKSNDVLFQCNNGYLPWCKECTDSYVSQMTALYSNNEEIAMQDFCQRAGWNYDLNALTASMETYNGHRSRSRISHYAAKKNLNCGGRKTYIDTLKFNYENRRDEVIENPNDIEDLDTQYKLTSKMIKFWGSGYEPKVYPTLQGYYDELLKLCSEKPDVKKQKMMKNLCLLEYQMQVNIQAGKDIGTLSNSYKAMFEAAELKTENADISNDAFGKWVMDIEKYSPAEYYQDKNKYHDFFGIVEYIERFMFRPLKNLIFGTKEKEKEYWVNDEDIGIKGGE